LVCQHDRIAELLVADLAIALGKRDACALSAPRSIAIVAPVSRSRGNAPKLKHALHHRSFAGRPRYRVPQRPSAKCRNQGLREAGDARCMHHHSARTQGRPIVYCQPDSRDV
jgi:hypothetical protein